MVRISLVGLLALTACAPRTPAPPARPDRPEFASCDWGEVRGADLSIWSFACGPSQSNEHLVADETLPGFALVGGEGAQAYRRVVVQTFAKPPEAPIDTVLDQVRAASGAPPTCGFAAAAWIKDRSAFQLAPVGAAAAQWEAQEAKGEPADPPCGSMGVSPVGERWFEVMPGHPGRVLYLDMGSEVQIFDPQTLRVIAKN